MDSMLVQQKSAIGGEGALPYPLFQTTLGQS